LNKVVSSIAAGAFVAALAWGARPTAAASSSDAAEPIVVASAVSTPDRGTPPVLFAQTALPVAPAAQRSLAPSPLAMQSHVVTPDGAQPGVWWLLVMGAVLYRVGARVVRGS
jgi:hypothetical protein